MTWTPLRRRAPVLRDLELSIPAGQRVLLTGPSGAGKSTLLRALAGLLETADNGTRQGRVLLDGSPNRKAGDVGLLVQDPSGAVVAETVGRDVAFGLENLAVSRDLMWHQVRRALDAAALSKPLDHPTAALSGGETQRLALAASLALESRMLLLDEPTSMLDDESAAEVRSAVIDAVAARGTTLVVVEHHLEPWVPLVDRVVVLGRDGMLLADGEPSRVLDQQGAALADHGVWVPGLAAPDPVALPPSLVEPAHDFVEPAAVVEATTIVVELRRRTSGRRSSTVAVDGVGAQLDAGSVLAVTGASGAGKSTLLAVLAGLQRPTSGLVLAAQSLAPRRSREPWRWRSGELAARIAWVPQFSEHGVVARTVLDEVLATARAVGQPEATARARAEDLLDVFGLAPLATASPYHLSGGEQRRLAVASALVHGATALMLDEPTVGQDRLTWQAVTGAMAGAARSGAAVALASHDRLVVDVVADARLALSAGHRIDEEVR